MTANGEYSTIIRPCTGNTDNPMTEPGPYAWAEENSVDDGYLTLHKIFFFTLNDGKTGAEFWASHRDTYDVCPAEVMRSSGFPQKWERLAEDTNYHFTGNGQLRHDLSNGRIWTFDAEYTSRNEYDSDGYSRDDATPPWKRKPTNISIELDTVECPLVAGFDRHNSRFKQIVDRNVGTVGYLVRELAGNNAIRNSAGDPINARGTKYVLKVNFTYCLKPTDFSGEAVFNKIGSVNSEEITVIGIKIRPGGGRIVQLHPQFIDDWESSSFKRKRPYWEIQTTLQLSMDNDSFNQKLMNTGNRAKFFKNVTVNADGTVSVLGGTDTVVDDIFSWKSWDLTHGQALGTIQFGTKETLVKAKKMYQEKTAGKSLPEFTYEEMQNIPLTVNGFVDKDAMDPNNARFGDYLFIEPLEFPREDWAHLNFPKKGVDW